MDKNYLYFDAKGKPAKPETAVLCVIQDLDAASKVIRETEIPITDEDEA